MKKKIALTMVILAAMGLSACGQTENVNTKIKSAVVSTADFSVSAPVAASETTEVSEPKTTAEASTVSSQTAQATTCTAAENKRTTSENSASAEQISATEPTEENIKHKVASENISSQTERTETKSAKANGAEAQKVTQKSTQTAIKKPTEKPTQVQMIDVGMTVLIAIVMMVVGVIMWNSGIRAYESAGS